MTTPHTPRPPSRVTAEWRGAHRFEAGRVGPPTARLDGSAETGQSPPDALLSALASCAGIDVLDFLAKRRTPVAAMRVEVVGTRRETPPRRFTRIELDFVLDGEGIERTHAERGVRLAFTTYCSVAASLAPDIELWARVTIGEDRGELVRQPGWTPG
ncbi:MAG TPA: OsmC family protein [Gemmatimonadaceae bacterium]|nr:OsmC family protein [Gemmatimonadaceae bacterium]